MKEIQLTNEELSRAMLKYLVEKAEKNPVAVNQIEYKDINKSFLKLKNKNVNPFINFESVKNKLINWDEKKDYLKPISAQEQSSNSHVYYTPLEQEQNKVWFLHDKTMLLGSNSPSFLKQDVDVILASISRDIRTIAYAINFPQEVKATAILEAKRQGYIFDKDTPFFMLQNEELIKQNLKLNKNAGIYIVWEAIPSNVLSNIEKYIVNEQIDFILNPYMPISFKRNSDICIISAKNDLDSVQYFDWDFLEKKPEAMKRLFDVLMDKGYVLNSNSPQILRNNVKICLNSIKKDIHSARYFSRDIQYWLTTDLKKFPIKQPEDVNTQETLYEIRKLLLKNGYYSLEEISKFPLSLISDSFLLDYYLEQLGISKETENLKDEIFYNRLKEFINTVLFSPLKISNIRKVFRMVAQKKWEEYRSQNNDYYTNIFNRICASLEQNNNFIVALNELKFLMKIDDVLDEKKYALFNAFVEYHQIYHSPHIENKIELLQAKRDSIAKNAALFISKSKEDFINEQMQKFDDTFKHFFIVRIDNPIVKKKVVEVKQRQMLKKQFDNQNSDLMQKLKLIKNEYLAYPYHNSLGTERLSQIIDSFIFHSINGTQTSIDDILPSLKPDRFDEYEVFEKVSKLINRLNSHHIDYNGKEVSNYKDFIEFDGEKYVYKGNLFSETELEKIYGYKDLKYVFGKIKSKIIQIAKSIDDFDELTQDDIKAVIDECPFTDEYYQLNSSYILDRHNINFLYQYIRAFDEEREILSDDKNYRALQNLFYDSGLIQLSMMANLGVYDGKSPEFNDIKQHISDSELDHILVNIPGLLRLISADTFTIDNLSQILDLKDMFNYADLKQISLLGKDVMKKIYSNNGFTSSTQKERINVACDLASSMVLRSQSTVPYINGTYYNYRYSMYDSTDMTLLTSGLDTNACFRCCGNDNDFLHYCALDKNGFVIKLTNADGEFIGRASGFRNGNGVYINQLRTVYDKKTVAYSSEKNMLIKAFQQACNDIVETSQNNPQEEHKIDFIVVTKSYTLDDTASNVDDVTRNVIGKYPMDTKSEDWNQFKTTTKNLKETISNNRFTTDFEHYSLICMASAVGSLTPEKIKKGDVPALYERKRREITINEPNEDVENFVNRVRACHSYQTGEKFEYIKIPKDCKIVTGDNWYIVLGTEGIIDRCYLTNDRFATQEITDALGQILINQVPVEEIHDLGVKK